MRRPQRRSKLIAEINIAPFTDVILVLLIVFMVTTPLIYRSHIKVALPKVGSKKQASENKDINVYISATGDVQLDSQKYNLKFDKDIFNFKLKQLIDKNNDASIVINGDRSVKYDYIVQVVDAASTAGIKHLVLATEFKR